MDYEIIQINEHSWRIEDGGVRFFLLEGTEKALVIDTGMHVKNVKGIAESLTKLPIELINTHADPDHSGGNDTFDKFYMSPADEPKYRKMGGTGTLVPVKGGDIIDLGGRPLAVVDLPGHTEGSIAIIDLNARVLIGGDSIAAGNIYMFGPGRDINKYIESMKSLKAHASLFDIVWPSHYGFPLGVEMIDKLIEGAQAIVDGKIPGEIIDKHGTEVRVCDIGGAGFYCNK